jgi:hypothetical protein
MLVVELGEEVYYLARRERDVCEAWNLRVAAVFEARNDVLQVVVVVAGVPHTI